MSVVSTSSHLTDDFSRPRPSGLSDATGHEILSSESADALSWLLPLDECCFLRTPKPSDARMRLGERGGSASCSAAVRRTREPSRSGHLAKRIEKNARAAVGPITSAALAGLCSLALNAWMYSCAGTHQRMSVAVTEARLLNVERSFREEHTSNLTSVDANAMIFRL